MKRVRRTNNGTKPVFCVRNLDNLYFNSNSTFLRKQWAKNHLQFTRSLKNRQKGKTSNMPVNRVDCQIPEENVTEETHQNWSNSQRTHRLKSLSTSELPTGMINPSRRRTSSVSSLTEADRQIGLFQSLNPGEGTISHIDLCCLNDSKLTHKHLQKNVVVKQFLDDKTADKEEQNQSSKPVYNHLVNEGHVGAGRSQLGVKRDMLCRSICYQKKEIALIVVGVFLVLALSVLYLYLKIDPDLIRNVRTLEGSGCNFDFDCNYNMVCDNKRCACSPGFQLSADRRCFKGYGANCTAGYQCLKYGECRKDSTGKSKCQCLTDRTVYEPELEPFDQCRRLAGAECSGDSDCSHDLKCNKYCTCNEIDLYFEQNNFMCEDACAKRTKNLLAIFKGEKPVQYPHPTKCGFYYTCSPRKLMTCPSGYAFDQVSQSCDNTKICKYYKE